MSARSNVSATNASALRTGSRPVVAPVTIIIVSQAPAPVANTDDVPRDGDTAHRRGYALCDNPHPDYRVQRRMEWDKNWRFRHDNAPREAADAPGNRLRPSENARSWACK